jgi:hypothetical protein
MARRMLLNGSAAIVAASLAGGAPALPEEGLKQTGDQSAKQIGNHQGDGNAYEYEGDHGHDYIGQV